MMNKKKSNPIHLASCSHLVIRKIAWMLTFFLWFACVSLHAQEADSSGESKNTEEKPKKAKEIYLLSQSLQLGKKPAWGAFFSADNQQILILSGNGSIELYSAQSGKRHRVIPTVDHQGVTLEPHPGGQLAVTGGKDDTVRIWNTHQTTSQGVLRGHLDEITSLALNVTGDVLVSGSKDGMLILWDMKTHEILKSTKIFSRGAVRHVAFHPGGSTLAIGGENGSLEIRSVPDMKVVVQLSSHKGHITGLQYTPRGNHLVSSSRDGKLIQWEWKSGNLQREIDFKEKVSTFHIHPQNMEVIVGTEKGRLETWSLETGKLLHQINKGGPAIVHVKYDRNGYRLLSAMKDGNVQLWELGASLHLKTLSGHARPIDSLDFSKNGKYLISSSSDKSVRIWDVKSGKPARTYDMGSHRVEAVRFAPDSQSFATAGADSSVVIWGTQDGERVYNLRSHKGKVNAIAFHPTDAVLLSGGSDRQWTLWDLNSGKAILSQQGHLDQILSASFSPDGSMFATSSSDRTVMLWSYPKGEELATFRGHRKAVTSVAFSDNGRKLASGSQDNQILLWNLKPEITNAPNRQLEGHGFIVNQVVFSKDNKALLSVSRDKTLRLWEVKSGKMFRILHGDETPLTSVALSSDGKNIALSNLSNQISIHNYPEDLQEMDEIITEKAAAPTEKVKLETGGAESLVLPDDGEVEAPIVNLDDLGDADQQMTAEELRAYAAPELPKNKKVYVDSQRKLNILLKAGETCKNAESLEKLAHKVISKVPDDLAAYHALAKLSVLRGDFNGLALVTMVARDAVLYEKIYNYSSMIQIRNVFNSWQNQIFDQSFIRRGNQQQLRQVSCDEEPKGVQLSEITKKFRCPLEFTKKIREIPRIIDFRDFLQIEEQEFANRMYREIMRLQKTSMPHPLSRLPMMVSEKTEALKIGYLNLNLEKAQTWKSEGVATFQLRKANEAWQTFLTDEDNKVVMMLPEGKYSLKVAGKVTATFLLNPDSTVELEVD